MATSVKSVDSRRPIRDRDKEVEKEEETQNELPYVELLTTPKSKCAINTEEYLDIALKELGNMNDDEIRRRALNDQAIIANALHTCKGSAAARDNIAKHTGDLVYMILTLQKKVEKLERIIQEKEPVRGVDDRGKDTYASKVKKGKVDIVERARSRSRGRQNHVVLVYPKEEISSDDTKKQIQENVSLANMSGGVVGIRKINKGGIAIEVEEQVDLNKIIEQVKGNVNTNKKFNVNLPKKLDPQLIIFNVEDCYEKEELVAKLVEQNDEISGVEDLEVKTRFKGRYGVNWILAVKPIAFGRLKDKGKVHIGWQRCSIKHNVRPLICYKCGKYGHLSRVCKNASRCLKCGEAGHERRDCESEVERCFNCKTHNDRFGTKYDFNHSCLERRCKVYEKEVDKVINRTYYGP